jgi:hypothetical protein
MELSAVSRPPPSERDSRMKIALALIATLLLADCTSSGLSSSAVPNAPTSAFRQPLDVLGGAPTKLFPVQLALFDAPIPNAGGAQVNVALEGIQLLSGTTTSTFSTFRPEKNVNLIALQKGAMRFDGHVPAGPYTGVRLLIDTAKSNVVLFGYKIPIVWGSPGNPSPAAVIAVDFNVAFGVGGGGGDTKVTLDFNVMESVKFANGAIYVQPSVTAANAAAQAQGRVRNAAGKPVYDATVLALDLSGHIVNSTATAADGTFVLHALPPGQYTIVVQNSYTTSAGTPVNASGNDAGAAPTQSIVLSPEDNLDLGTLID